MIQINYDKCDLCGACVGVCPFDAMELTEVRLSVIHTNCTECNFCVEICPFEVLSNDGIPLKPRASERNKQSTQSAL
jgi:ferredoxin